MVDDSGAEMLPQMLEQLGKGSTLPSHQQQQQQHLYQQQQRRMLPQIPRSHSPSDLQNPSYPSSELEPPAYYPGKETLPVHHARHRHRRQSSLELERQQQQLGLSDFSRYLMVDDYGQPIQGHEHAFERRLPPTISVSPELATLEPPELEYLHHQNQAYAGHPHRIPPDPVAPISAYQQHPFLSVRPQHQHHASQHHLPANYVSRSVAMGSDSELNTRGLSSNKLYYVHVPPARRSRHHRQQPQVPQQARPTRPPIVDMQQQPQMVHELPLAGRHQLARQPRGQTGERYLADERLVGGHEHIAAGAQLGQRRSPVVGAPDYSWRSMPVYNVGQAEQLAQQQQAQHQLRACKGVTFDGRTSAPVYGRRKRESRESYLRANSEEHAPEAAQQQHRATVCPEQSGAEESEDNEDRSSSIASKASNASYSASDHHMQLQQQQQQQQQPRASTITAAEFNIQTAEPASRDSWPSQQDERLHLEAIAATAKQRRPSRGPEFPNFGTQEARGQQRHRASRARQRQLHEGDSFTDTGGASLSDKEPGGLGSNVSSSEIAAGRSERRARVRDQQSSNERSFGDGAGGSSQSLKSQSGMGSASGGLSKKSNSTTQLSLSGKHLPHPPASSPHSPSLANQLVCTRCRHQEEARLQEEAGDHVQRAQERGGCAANSPPPGQANNQHLVRRRR